MLKSEYLPEWLKTIESRDVFETLMQKLADGFVHYQQKLGKAVDLKEFFDKYTEHLKETGKLYYHCKYKGKPVEHDSKEWCLESYCSKKPYRSPCSYSTLKFGTTNN
jgi:proline racemase